MSSDRDLRNAVEILPGRLYYAALPSIPTAHQQRHFFSIDNELVYWNFFLDFGPLNFGQLYRFCGILNSKLADSRLKDKVIYYYSGTHPHRRANAAFLICAWSMLCLQKGADEAYRPFRGLPFPPWHDATPTACTYNLTVLDTLKGLQKARECNFFDFENFNIEEYEHYEKVENGDLNWCMAGKFIMFAGPHATRETGPGGYQTLCPEDYISYFKRRNVTLVVRLNKKYYDARKFTSQGIDHVDLYFLDGSNPPDHILAKFIQLCEETPGAVAVHCKAGLGRTGSCIGAYIMKHFKWTAEELIGWLRIVRPGSIIGPQQQFMQQIQARMWRDGDIMRARESSATTAIPQTRVGIEGRSRGGSAEEIDGGGGAVELTGEERNSVVGATVLRIGDGSGSLSSKLAALSVKGTGTGTATSASTSSRSSSRGSAAASAAAAALRETEGESQGDSLRARRQQMKEETLGAGGGGGASGTVTGRSSSVRASGGISASSAASSTSAAAPPLSPSSRNRTTIGSFLSGWGK